MSSLSHTAQHTLWSRQLQEISKQPLELCPQFPEIAARWESWWNFSADRPLVIAWSQLRPDIYWGKSFHLLDNPEQWMETKLLQMKHTRFIDSTVPGIRVDIGPAAPAAFFGAPLMFSEEEQTSWNTPIIETWNPAPQFKFDPDNKWFRIVTSLCERVAKDARGRYLVCLPDMSGALDTLSNMRSPDRLCMDLHDEERDAVRAGAMQMADEWQFMYKGVLDAILDNGAGYVNQLQPWSNTPYVVPTCDFNALIGPNDFIECCLPSLERQAYHAGRICFHLDGPQAARHAPALCKQDWAQVIQYTPGAGTPSALAKLDMLRSFQKAGKPIMVFSPLNEIKELASKLDRRGLTIFVPELVPPNEVVNFEAAIRNL